MGNNNAACNNTVNHTYVCLYVCICTIVLKYLHMYVFVKKKETYLCRSHLCVNSYSKSKSKKKVNILIHTTSY